MRTFFAAATALVTLSGLATCEPEAGTGQSSKSGGAVGADRGVTAVVEMEPSFGRKTAVDIVVVVDGSGRGLSQVRGRWVRVYHPKIGIGVKATAYEQGTIRCYFEVGGVPVGRKTTILEGPHPTGSVECTYAVDPRDRT